MKSAVPAEETTALQWMNSFAAQRTKYLRFAQVQFEGLLPFKFQFSALAKKTGVSVGNGHAGED